MKVVVPMSGMSSRFGTAGYTIPKYLIEVDGKTVIEHIIDLYPKDETDFIFIVNRNIFIQIKGNQNYIRLNFISNCTNIING